MFLIIHRTTKRKNEVQDKALTRCYTVNIHRCPLVYIAISGRLGNKDHEFHYREAK